MLLRHIRGGGRDLLHTFLLPAIFPLIHLYSCLNSQATSQYLSVIVHTHSGSKGRSAMSHPFNAVVTYAKLLDFCLKKNASCEHLHGNWERSTFWFYHQIMEKWNHKPANTSHCPAQELDYNWKEILGITILWFSRTPSWILFIVISLGTST